MIPVFSKPAAFVGAMLLSAMAAVVAVAQPAPGGGTASGAEAAPAARPRDGKTLYVLYCAGCHNPGPGHPATMRLTELGRPHPPLIGRTDLDPNYIRSVVHNGLIEMPPFRPTELTEDDLTRLISYIKSAGAVADVSAVGPSDATVKGIAPGGPDTPTQAK